MRLARIAGLNIGDKIFCCYRVSGADVWRSVLLRISFIAGHSRKNGASWDAPF
jgi:hypothetical protein